ncbi:MAG: hypothetical protein ACJAVQ_000708, partial [Nonlabens sp.]
MHAGRMSLHTELREQIIKKYPPVKGRT